MPHWIVIPAAVALDMFLGDPRRLPHPVRWMGNAITALEPFCRRWRLPLVVSGGIFWFMLVAGTGLLVWSGAAAVNVINPKAGIILQIILIYYAISARSLFQEAMAVHRALAEDNLESARKRVAMIVGRDTRELSASEVARAAVETVAENLVDGFAAPLFFAALGGAPLALMYKMVNTLDSMVGYKDDDYRLFGKVSARMDDLWNYLPARLSVPLIALAAELYRKGSFKRTLHLALRDGRNHTSPNAGFAEAAFAGALQIRLGGPSTYQDRVVDKPYLGAEFTPPERRHIRPACRLMLLAAVLLAMFIWLVFLCF